MTDTQDKPALIVEREGAVAALAEDRSVRAVVFSAAGEENFSVGMNLKELPEGIKKMGGPEALRMGLVNELWPVAELKQRGAELAAERRAVMATFGTRDMAEGMAAFMEKRKPHFTGE
jgi:enoyl-CoA hydratase/carnithine racemase